MNIGRAKFNESHSWAQKVNVLWKLLANTTLKTTSRDELMLWTFIVDSKVIGSFRVTDGSRQIQ